MQRLKHRRRTLRPRKKSMISTFNLLCANALAFSGLLHSQLSSADHATAPTHAVAAGSFQSALGCSDNWQPDCTATALTADGDVWATTLDLPAGDWSFKIALNHAWDESYGDNGNNVELQLLQPATVTIRYDQITHRVSHNAPKVVIQPTTVNIAGSFQTSLSCSGDWQPDCAQSGLQLRATDQIWKNTFLLNTGNWEYKATIDGSWNENYGANAARDGSNIALAIDTDTSVNFYYDHESHWITDNVNSVIATLAGDFQTQLGCADNWQPECLKTWLKDIDGDGIYRFTAQGLAAGDYQVKVAHNESWDENYGAGGIANGSNIQFTVAPQQETVEFSYDANTHLLTVGDSAFQGDLKSARAYWLTRDTLAWDTSDTQVDLFYSPSAQLVVSSEGIHHANGDELTPISLRSEGVVDGPIAEKFRHLSGLPTFKIPTNELPAISQILKSQIALQSYNQRGNPTAATAIQPPGVLDDVYGFDGDLGLQFDRDQPRLALWAPTAQAVNLLLFADSDPGTASQSLPMNYDSNTGVWSIEGDSHWDRQFYQFEVTVYARSTGRVEINRVTDPYSVSLSMNSQRSQIVNLKDRDLKPRRWNKLRKPKLKDPEDQVIYELHVRDFSVHDDSVAEVHQGKFTAFTQKHSVGMEHLRNLSWTGVSSVHLLPAFDCATINEDPAQQVSSGDLSGLPGDSEEQQAIIESIRGADGFNWCYDPYHYTVPEGSYSTNPDGETRIREFREMVASLNRSGLRVIMDVVYNHTSGSLQGDTSVLDKIVPDYYHRLNANGDIETSSCCANTASEHQMMEKLMLDSLRTWAVDYKVDGFRFDLMGHHTKANILKARDMLNSLTKREHGVDGRSIYLYGEGWNFGEVVNDTRFEQATQKNMGQGTGIGSFNDHIRDAVRGGGPFDTGFQHVEQQGFINGQFYDPNTRAQASLEDLLRATDKIRMGLAGTLSDYEFENYEGQRIQASSIGGYTSDPQESINYIAAHDNETLFDANQYKLPLDTSTDDRVRAQNLGNSIVVLAQGIPFLHAGQEILRSKSMDRNSYDSGDWFNILDFSLQDNGWARGLPRAADNLGNWSAVQPRLANPDLAVEKKHQAKALFHMYEMLLIRQTSPLFRLETAEQIQQAVKFHNTGPNQIPGLIAMSLEDRKGIRHMVFFNATPEPLSFTVESLKSKSLAIHPIHRWSLDKRVKQSQFDKDTGTFVIPARTTTVFNRKSFNSWFK